jgi:hypothetical protein
MALPIYENTVVNDNGDVQPSSTITVYNEASGIKADIFSHRDGGVSNVKDNPFITDEKGFVQFYAAPGEYRVEAVTGSGTVTRRYQVLAGEAAFKEVGLGGSQLPSNTNLASKFGFAGDAIAIPSDNAQNNTVGGAIYRVTATTTNVPSWAGDGSTIFAQTVDSTDTTEDVRLFLISADGQRTATASIVGGVLGDWSGAINESQVASHDSVDQGLTAGGHIIESGTNANGHYIMFADRSMCCFKTSSTAYTTSGAVGSAYYSNGESFTFPATFSSVKSVSPANIGAGSSFAHGGYVYAITVSGCIVGSGGPTSDSQFKPGYIAWGTY